MSDLLLQQLLCAIHDYLLLLFFTDLDGGLTAQQSGNDRDPIHPWHILQGLPLYRSHNVMLLTVVDFMVPPPFYRIVS